MANFEISCDEVTVSNWSRSSNKLTMSFDADEDDILEEVSDSEITYYAATKLLSEVIDSADAADVLNEFSWSDVKDHFQEDIISEACAYEDQILEEIGWYKIKEHFQDEIDALASEIAQDLVDRGVE